jgi:hypothetical protein
MKVPAGRNGCEAVQLTITRVIAKLVPEKPERSRFPIIKKFNLILKTLQAS